MEGSSGGPGFGGGVSGVLGFRLVVRVVVVDAEDEVVRAMMDFGKIDR